MKKETWALVERLEKKNNPGIVWYVRHNDCALGEYMIKANISDCLDKLIIVVTLDY